MFRKKQTIRFIPVMMAVFMTGIMTACAPHSVRKAEHVVAQADSLRAEGKMYGIDEGDSAQLAQAYITLHTWRVPFSSPYAHASYHYGRLLREKDDPVSAMQVFINATHSHTRDYHILGRVYSNMGDICHLANEFNLSYDMFERSADMFLRNGDSIAYYYALNDMAFELVMQEKREEALSLLAQITNNCSDKDVLAKLSETKAYVYEQTKQYDSALIILDQQLWYNASKCVMKARAFEYQNKTDSALYYARQVMTLPDASEQDKYNMLYILINYNPALENEEIIALSAQRSDIETKVLISLHNQWAMAVQLLEQDLTRKPDWRWLYTLIGTLIIVSMGIGIYVHKKRKKQELLSQKVEKLKQSASAIQEKQNKLYSSYQTKYQRMEEDIINQCILLRENDNITKDLKWNDFEALTQVADKYFYKLISKLRCMQVLNETEIRLCLLVLIDMNRTEISNTLPYSLSGVGKLKDHTAKSLGTTGKNLRQYLINLAIEG